MPSLLAINEIFGSPPHYSWLKAYYEIFIRKGKIYQERNGGKQSGTEENFNEMERLY